MGVDRQAMLQEDPSPGGVKGAAEEGDELREVLVTSTRQMGVRVRETIKKQQDMSLPPNPSQTSNVYNPAFFRKCLQSPGTYQHKVPALTVTADSN